MKRVSICATTSLVAAAMFGAQANAQAPGTQDEQSETARPQQAEDSGTDEKKVENTIVVTALRREQQLEEVPVAVTAISGDLINSAGLQDSRGLQSLTPGLRLDATGNYNQPTLRGVTTTLLNLSNDSNVATYIDGVYQQTNISAIYELADVTDVQVLKGPQGTLFGRNATGGAILINTRDPSFSPTGTVGASYARFDDITLQGFASGPLSDTVAVSVSGVWKSLGESLENIATGEEVGDVESYLVRGKLRFMPREGIDITAGATISRRDDGYSEKFTTIKGNHFLRGSVPDSMIPTEPFTVATDIDPRVITETASGQVTAKFNVGGGQLISTTAYTDFDVPYLQFDTDITAALAADNRQQQSSNTFTQELLYNFEVGSKFEGTVGAFYFDNTASFYNSQAGFGAQSAYMWKSDADAWAVFSEGTFHITDRLSLLLGGRYSWETRNLRGAVASGTTEMPTDLPDLGEETWSDFTPRASIMYGIGDRTNIFFTYSEGFKSGAFNFVSSTGIANPVDPEKIKSYEGGIKSAGRNYNLSATIYYYDYTDLQVGILQQDPDTGLFSQLFQNAASSEIYGSEIEGSWEPVDGLSLSAGIAYLHGRYKEFEAAGVTAWKTTGTASCDPNPPGVTYNGGVTLLCDVSGNATLKSPEWSGNLNAAYTMQLPSGELEMTGTLYASSRIYYDVLNRVSQSPYATLGASLAYRPECFEGLELSVYGRNLTDQKVFSGVATSVIWDSAVYELPLQVGGRIKYVF